MGDLGREQVGSKREATPAAMDMTLSKRGDYVMRSAIALARAHASGHPRKIREVVADTEVPQSFASQILADLVRAGLATSRAGRDGGYRLARDPEEITVLEVIEAAEGPLRAERCALGDGPCRWDSVCPLHETWSAATVSVRDVLAQTSLMELAQRDEQLEAGTYVVPADAHRSHPISVEVRDAVQVELGVDDALRSLGQVQPVLAGLVAEAADAGSGAANPTTGARRPRTEATGRAPRSRTIIAPATTTDATLAPAGSARRGHPTTFLLGWRHHGGAGAATLDAELTVAPLDEERCQIEVHGTWRQAPGSGQLQTRADLERRARTVLRSFLRALAGTLEAPADSPSQRSLARR